MIKDKKMIADSSNRGENKPVVGRSLSEFQIQYGEMRYSSKTDDGNLDIAFCGDEEGDFIFESFAEAEKELKKYIKNNPNLKFRIVENITNIYGWS